MPGLANLTSSRQVVFEAPDEIAIVDQAVPYGPHVEPGTHGTPRKDPP